MTYVSDTVAGFIAAATTPGIEGLTINLGTGETYSVGWFAERLLSLMGMVKPIVQETQRMRPELSEVLKLVSDNTLALKTMAWSPKVTLDDGLQQTIAFIRANRDLFRADEYVR
jgi:nucleoside-diphosphate-sugar epimerase